MANEFETSAPTGTTVKVLLRNSAKQIWQTTTSTFVTWVDANRANYLISLTEQGTSGFFSGDMPTAITTPDTYAVEFWTGTSSNTFYAGGTFYYNGAAIAYSTTGSALTTLAYVKDYAGITVTTYDSYLTNRLNAASAIIQTKLNRSFPLQTYTEYYDGVGSTTLQLRNTPVTAITSITLNPYSSTPTVINGSDIIFNLTTGLVSVGSSSLHAGWFGYDYYSGQQNILVVYTAGYSTIPQDLQEAVAQVVTRMYLARGADLTMSMEKIGDYQYMRAKDAAQFLTDDIMANIFHYMEIAV